jgi:hypothetical protein
MRCFRLIDGRRPTSDGRLSCLAQDESLSIDHLAHRKLNHAMKDTEVSWQKPQTATLRPCRSARRSLKNDHLSDEACIRKQWRPFTVFLSPMVTALLGWGFDVLFSGVHSDAWQPCE